jgi:Na+-transporting NADH:ubiquinone oxidoreductase subunit NqrE
MVVRLECDIVYQTLILTISPLCVFLQAYFKLAEMHANGLKLSDPVPVPLAAINCVILGCANIWDVDRAYQTFESIGSTFGLRPDVHSINALLEAFGKNRKVCDIHNLFIGT